jgi:hypothetical protein
MRVALTRIRDQAALRSILESDPVKLAKYDAKIEICEELAEALAVPLPPVKL